MLLPFNREIDVLSYIISEKYTYNYLDLKELFSRFGYFLTIGLITIKSDDTKYLSMVKDMSISSYFYFLCDYTNSNIKIYPGYVRHNVKLNLIELNNDILI